MFDLKDVEENLKKLCTKCSGKIPENEVWVLQMPNSSHPFCSERCFKAWCKRKGIQV